MSHIMNIIHTIGIHNRSECPFWDTLYWLAIADEDQAKSCASPDAYHDMVQYAAKILAWTPQFLPTSTQENIVRRLSITDDLASLHVKWDCISRIVKSCVNSQGHRLDPKRKRCFDTEIDNYLARADMR